jgi:hypothetical protein
MLIFLDGAPLADTSVGCVHAFCLSTIVRIVADMMAQLLAGDDFDTDVPSNGRRRSTKRTPILQCDVLDK